MITPSPHAAELLGERPYGPGVITGASVRKGSPQGSSG
jgi:hypothetical protein